MATSTIAAVVDLLIMTDLPVAKQSKLVFLDQAGDERLHRLFQ
jgi:hypothetical protein